MSEIRKVIDASDCEEVILELEGIRLVVRRGNGASGQGGVAHQLAATAPVVVQPTPAIAPAPATSEMPTSPQPAASGTQIRAPMVGSFYRRPSPDQPAFVEVGARVEAGDPLCLIEVMKLYTTIEATVSGTIKQIAVEDTQLVEFDQLLFVIAPD